MGAVTQGENTQGNRKWAEEGTLTLTKGLEREKLHGSDGEGTARKTEEKQLGVVPLKPKEERIQERGNRNG